LEVKFVKVEGICLAHPPFEFYAQPLELFRARGVKYQQEGGLTNKTWACCDTAYHCLLGNIDIFCLLWCIWCDTCHAYYIKQELKQPENRSNCSSTCSEPDITLAPYCYEPPLGHEQSALLQEPEPKEPW